MNADSDPARPTRRKIASSIVWNWAGIAVQTAFGFAIAPFLIDRLGDSTYGLWILMGSLTEGLGLLDFGVRSSVGRQLAFSRSQGDRRAVNAIVTAAILIMCCVGALVFAASGVMTLYLPRLTDLTAGDVEHARTALLLVGFTYAVYGVASVFDGALWSLQRFDTLNRIDIPITLLRAGLTYGFVANGFGLEALAIIALTTNLLAGAAKAACSFKFDEHLRVGLSHYDVGAARRLFGYGWWNFVTMVGSRLRLALAPALIGSSLGLAFITPFSITVRLIGYGAVFMTAATGVLTPVATTFGAQQMEGKLRRLVGEGGKFCFVLTLFLALWLVVLGESFIVLWIGRRFSGASSLLTILVCGEFLPMAQLVGQTVIMATARHRVLAFWSVTEAVLGMALAAMLVRVYGLTGLCVALAIAAMLCRGVATLIYSCRIVKISMREYVATSILPALAVASVPTIGLVVLVRIFPPDTWFRLVVCSTLFAAGFAAASIPLFGYGQVLLEGRRFASRLRGAL